MPRSAALGEALSLPVPSNICPRCTLVSTDSGPFQWRPDRRPVHRSSHAKGRTRSGISSHPDRNHPNEMSRRARNSSRPANQRELRSLLLSLHIIRVLHLLRSGPLTPALISERLSLPYRNGPAPGVDRTLLRLRRRGWIRAADAALVLTPQGEHALTSACSDLDLLHRLLNSGEQ